MEAAIPAFILFVVVLVRFYMATIRRSAEAQARPRCQLHKWERMEIGLVCRECGLQPSLD